MAKPRICASCRASMCEEWEIQGVEPAEAEFYVEGRVLADNNSGWRPYRAYLCLGHMEMMLIDGAEFPVQRKL